MDKAKIGRFIQEAEIIGDLELVVSSKAFDALVFGGAFVDLNGAIKFYGPYGVVTIKRRPTLEERVAALEAKIK